MDVILAEGRVRSADSTVQAVLRMWDDNLLILKADKKIGNKMKKGDFVLADYTPVSETSPYRKMIITKILPREKGQPIWDEFRMEHEKRKQGEMKRQPMPYIR